MDPNYMNMANYQSSQQMSAFPAQTPIGMAYVPVQMLHSIYEPDAGLQQGTIFPELDKPWLGSRAFAYGNNAIAGMSNVMGQSNVMGHMPHHEGMENERGVEK